MILVGVLGCPELGHSGYWNAYQKDECQ